MLSCSLACFVEPCISGDLRSLYKVSTGLSFLLTMSGLLFIFQPLFGLRLLRTRCNDLVAGGYIVGSSFITLLSLTAAVLWGGEADTMAELVEYEMSGHNITANQSLLSTFSILSGLASIICICSACNVFLLAISREFYSDYKPDLISTVPEYYQHSSGRRQSKGREWKDHGAKAEFVPSQPVLSNVTSPGLSYQHQVPLLTEEEEEEEDFDSDSDSEAESGVWSGVSRLVDSV